MSSCTVSGAGSSGAFEAVTSNVTGGGLSAKPEGFTVMIRVAPSVPGSSSCTWHVIQDRPPGFRGELIVPSVPPPAFVTLTVWVCGKVDPGGAVNVTVEGLSRISGLGVTDTITVTRWVT